MDRILQFICIDINHVKQEEIIAQYQPLLQSIASKILGSTEDAKDVVQDTFLKWLSVDRSNIDNTKAYLIRSVKNNALSHLESLKNKKEEFNPNFDIIDKLDNWYKETEFPKIDIENELAAALFILQMKLEPLERAVFLMKEVFNFDYETIQETLEKRKDHLRQLVSRAKKKLAMDKENFSFPVIKKPEFINSVVKACDLGSFNDMIAQLKLEIASPFKK
ncbi:sigma-70 family RNA polymerase sigma factor [Fulvivirgaceae bacterium LMO-SS25]